jgi:hypothetical protein
MLQKDAGTRRNSPSYGAVGTYRRMVRIGSVALETTLNIQK